MIRANGEEVGRRGAEEIKCKQSNGCSVGDSNKLYNLQGVFLATLVALHFTLVSKSVSE